ncbi:MAG: betaine/proline/choline family ABC transporter ATP-binding protein [Lachnospirales bacterium]
MLEIQNISKSYGKTKVVKDLNLTINKGELIVLIGESGCGKSTTMQMINRLIEPTKGSIKINGINIKSINKNELRRNIGYVIQNVGLFPHYTIEENIGTVPALCKKNPLETKEKIKELMDTVGLDYEIYGQRYPRELSGGQQQRIGVARALANNPDIILMDEPFSALDPLTREQLQDELLNLNDELGKTIIFVTHDMDEAIKLGTKIAIMQDGVIVQYDTPEELLRNPVNDFVETFIGKNRLWKTPDLLKAEDVMMESLIVIEESRNVVQAIETMKKHNSNVLAIVETYKGKKKLMGLLGSNRLLRKMEPNTLVRDIMKTDVHKIKHDTPLTEVLTIREEKNVFHSPVVDENGSLLGMITNTSILNVLSQIMPGMEGEDY